MIRTKLTSDFIQGCHKRYKKDFFERIYLNIV